MGLLDDDSNFAAEAPEAEPDMEPAPEPTYPDQVPAHEMTGSYEHLWERTVVRSIEDAAVRDEPEEDHAVPAAPVGASPAPVDAAQANAPGQPEAAASLAPAHPAHEPAGPPATPPAAAAAARTIGGLIDSIPWRTGGTVALVTLAYALRRSNPDTELVYIGSRRSAVASLPLWNRSVVGVPMTWLRSSRTSPNTRPGTPGN